jgi:hypothetical protein
MTKKPAQLSDTLLNLRPRKGEAKPQSEEEASSLTAPTPAPAPSPVMQSESPAPRRRKRRSANTQQLNLRVSEKTLERFTALADAENVIFGDLLEKLLKHYEKR